MRKVIFSIIYLLGSFSALQAEVSVSNLFTNHMVVQQGKPVIVWGKETAGAMLNVSMAGNSATATADAGGRWTVRLPALKANSGPHEITIQGSSTIKISDILVGEVWICSGQSNMQWPVASANDPQLEALAAKFPRIRLITVPQVGTQEAQDNFDGQWKAVTPETVLQFSAVGYFFGRQLHQTLDVPVGLIDNAWGGSACEAWIPRDVLENNGHTELLAHWDKLADEYDAGAMEAKFQKAVENWKKRAAAAKTAGKSNPPYPRRPRNPLAGQHRPANLYQGVLNPIIGYPIQGAIWYQGEANATRAKQYQDLFPLMIKTWREAWKQGDFSFYWVSLADFKDEVSEPTEADWAELREAQTMTMSKLPNTGEAIITDLGEAHDIHPRNKQDVAKRLARWALAQNYGYTALVHRSPIYKSHEVNGNRVIVTFDHVGGGLDTHDVRAVRGFTIAGTDRKFHHAEARIIAKHQVEVWSDEVAEPASVRYAWANNPKSNLQNRSHLPATPFRTDQWKGITEGIFIR
ncbi:MAG: sialate O-acetylesterase [Planctomycetaceae bacterium]|nr:sialate O-acetylesterase [Planctomycetaceae bacterium]